MKNRLCETLGIEYPVIQGAMAWTAMAPLVAAVSEAGGLGVLGSGFMPPEVLFEQAAIIRSKTNKPFAANLFLDPGEQLEIGSKAIVEAKIPVVYIDTLNLLEYDLAKKYYDMMHEAGSKVVAKINCLQDALVAEKAGADVIITKGVEGGGHKAKISGRVLLAEVVENISSVPIVASGGIYTPRQLAGLIVQGADGIEMGSAFIATEECAVHQNVKRRILTAQDIDIVDIGETTGEGSWQIKNKLAERLMEVEAKYPREEAARMVIEMSAGSLRKAAIDGDVEIEGAIMVGQVGGLMNKIVPVSVLVKNICEDAEVLLKRNYTLGIKL
jgi:enoyl-[acyl-carrier protein] reductase II